ncbi:MAG: TonB-dependent receptor [Steroidobacteraceae bacterium]|jgi:outer membrane receptor protein involved in Fe transport|nr:TonB-dependent receptor [Steroidobacteraceae bacterium]
MSDSFAGRAILPAVCSWVLVAGTPIAATAAEDALEEVIVTAQKRELRLENVPVAITALSGDEVTRRAISNFADLMDEVTGVSINYAFGGSSYGLLSIRGVGGADDYKPNGSPSVALHVDGIYQTSNAYLTMPLFDIERLEVLKGPQGTLYGRNTTAGVVNALTRRPTTEFAGYADFRAGNYGAYAAEAALGGAVSDAVRVRVAALAERGGGFMDGRGAGLVAGFQPTIGGVRQTQVPPVNDPGPRNGFGDDDITALRATMEADLGDDTLLTLRGFLARDRGEIQPFDRIARSRDNTIFNAGEDEDPFVFFSNQYFEKDIDLGGVSAQLDHRFADDLDLKVLAGWQQTDRKLGGNGDGTPYPQFEWLFDERLSQFSVEAQLSDAAGGPVDWIVGAFYIADEADFLSTWTSLSVRSIYDSPYDQDRSSIAAFGQVDYALTDTLRLGVGLRYTWDEADYVGRNTDRNPWRISTFATAFGTTSGFAWDESFDDAQPSGRVSLQYSPTEALNVFVSWGRGYRAGGFDGTSIFTLEETLPFDSETVDAIEAGLRWSNDRARVALDVFDNRFRNLQATTRLANDTNGRTNVGRAETRGIEGSVSALLLRSASQRLDLNLGVAWLDSEITEFRSARVVDVQGTVGDPLPGAPDWTANLALTHQYSFGDGWSWTSRATVAYHGEESNRLNALPNNTVEPYTLANLRFELASPSGWTAYAYGRNVTDEVYFPELNGASRLVGPPATYGVGLRWTF